MQDPCELPPDCPVGKPLHVGYRTVYRGHLALQAAFGPPARGGLWTTWQIVGGNSDALTAVLRRASEQATREGIGGATAGPLG